MPGNREEAAAALSYRRQASRRQTATSHPQPTEPTTAPSTSCTRHAHSLARSPGASAAGSSGPQRRPKDRAPCPQRDKQGAETPPPPPPPASRAPLCYRSSEVSARSQDPRGKESQGPGPAPGLAGIRGGQSNYAAPPPRQWAKEAWLPPGRHLCNWAASPQQPPAPVQEECLAQGSRGGHNGVGAGLSGRG